MEKIDATPPSTTITKNKNISKSGPFEVRMQIQKYNTFIIVDPATTLHVGSHSIISNTKNIYLHFY